MTRLNAIVVAFVLVAAVGGCDSLDPGDVAQEYLVESYQVAGEPVKPVRLSRTAPLNTRYVFSERAVSGANVRINLLRADGTVDASYRLRENPSTPGVYEPTSADRIRPSRTYRLVIEHPDREDSVTAVTTVPDTFRVVRTNADTLVYQGPVQLELRVSRSSYPGRQTIFIFTAEALDPRPDLLTPFARRLWEENDVKIEDLILNSAPPLNEANYTRNDDGTLTIRMPWLMLAFYGPHRVAAHAIDDNLFDLVRSWQVQRGGSTLSPGEIPNLIDHVEGGTGVFGSYAGISYEFVVLPPEE